MRILNNIVISLLLISSHLYIMLNTNYVPDLYVFVHYAYVDNWSRNINYYSIYNNNFIFDALVVLGDYINCQEPRQWLYLIVTITALVSFLKYYTLLKIKVRIAGVFLIYLSSFFLDVNQLRFNMGMLILFIGINKISNANKVIYLIISFLSHIVPLILYILSIIISKIRTISIPLSLTITYILIVNKDYLIELNRIFLYISGEVFYFPKIIIVIIPISIYLYKRKKISESNNISKSINNLIILLVVVGAPLSIININLTARMFEIAYILVNVNNAILKRNIYFDLLLLIFSSSIILSRILGGISGNEEYVRIYEGW